MTSPNVLYEVEMANARAYFALGLTGEAQRAAARAHTAQLKQDYPTILTQDDRARIFPGCAT